MKKRKQEPKLTRWGDALNLAAPLQEYPRPQLWRKSCYMLNGLWEFTVQKEGEPRPRSYQDTIVVPFAPESILSGICKTYRKNQHLWYRRRLDFPKSFLKERLYCHFGGVDQCCIVYLNGYRVGRHQGGYLPFFVDLTPFLHTKGENILELEVWDEREQGSYAYGLQKKQGRFGSLLSYSGIWQPVWLESTPIIHIEGLRITPLYDEASVRIALQGSLIADAHVDILEQGTRVAAGTFNEQGICQIAMEHFRAWSPEDPYLYDLRVYGADDMVESYFAMRKVSKGKNANGQECLFLNNQPYFSKGVLMDEYWEDGLATAPDDRGIQWELETVKSLGFNTVRLHQKVESMRWYYHCDRLGLLVMQDMPRGGLFSPAEKKKSGIRSDKPGRYFGRQDISARNCFEEELEQLVKQLYNSPSVISYQLFEEGKGQFDALRLTETVWLADPTRLVDAACCGFDQGGGDIRSVSLLSDKRLRHIKGDERLLWIGAAGGFGLKGMRVSCGKYAKTVTQEKEMLREMYTRLQQEKEWGATGFVYLRFTDLPLDGDGLYSADREHEKGICAEIRARNQDISSHF